MNNSRLEQHVILMPLNIYFYREHDKHNHLFVVGETAAAADWKLEKSAKSPFAEIFKDEISITKVSCRYTSFYKLRPETLCAF